MVAGRVTDKHLLQTEGEDQMIMAKCGGIFFVLHVTLVDNNNNKRLIFSILTVLTAVQIQAPFWGSPIV